MSRQAALGEWLSSPRNLRLGALVLTFVAINQVDDALVDATVGQELLYWSVRLVVMVTGLWAADEWVARTLQGRWERPAWIKPVLVVSAIGLAPFALAEILIEPHLPMRPEYVDDELWAFSPPLAYLSEYVTVLSIVVPVHLLLWLLLDWKTRNAADAELVAAEPIPAFLERLPGLSTSAVVALEAEEHYVKVHTADGAEMVHYRFGNAVEQMPTELGLRVHRSWWVADRAVRAAKRGSRRWQLALDGDIAVPVSDSYVAAVRERGWLKRKPRG